MMGWSRHRVAVPFRLAALAPLAGVLLASCSVFTPAPDVPAPRVSFDGPHFTIFCHFDCGAAGAGARDAAEAAWALTANLFGVPGLLDTNRPRSPIHLYGRVEDYEAVEQSLTGGRLRENRAMTYRGAEAHLAVHPNLSPAVMREFGITANTLRVIGHEAAHIGMTRILRSSRRLPEWLSEGISSWVELETLAMLGLAPSRAEEPVSSTRGYLLREMLREERMPPLRAMLTGDAAALPLAERYAFYQHFFDFLYSGHRATALLGTLRSLDRIPGSGARLNRTLIERIVGEDATAIDRTEAAFHTWLLAFEPVWLQARRAISPVGETWLQVGFDNGAEVWRLRPAPVLPWTMEGRIRLLAGEGDMAAVLFTLEHGGTMTLTFRPGMARLERARFIGDPAPLRLAAATVPTLTTGAEVPFRVELNADGFLATIGDVTLRASQAPSEVGRWGLSAGPGANVAWSGVRVVE